MRHTPEQINAKLGHAQALAVAGRTQKEIAAVLGISVMTFHRWRNAHAHRLAAPGEVADSPPLLPVAPAQSDEMSRIAELKVENARLRKLVTDLLLERVKLEEEALAPSTSNIGNATLTGARR